MEVYRSRYLQLEFFADNEYIEMNWLATTELMLENEYKQELLNYLEIIIKLQPKKLIVDSRKSFFPLHPALQEWMNQTIFPPSLEIGLHQVAIVESSDFVHQLSVEQVMDEDEGSKFITKYFDSKEEATKWILSHPNKK